MLNRIVLVSAIMSLTISLGITQSQASENGEKIFKNYLCDHCHGENGRNPKSDMIPVIGGKDASFIREQATDILSGTRQGRAVVMHEKYYSSQATGPSCDAGPSSQELAQIADWLSKR